MSDTIDRIRRVRDWRDQTHPGNPAVSSQHWHDVNLLVNELDRLRQLEAIVRDLAAGSKPIDSQDFACVLCDADLFGRGEFGRDPAVHRESCPWRRAKELLGDE